MANASKMHRSETRNPKPNETTLTLLAALLLVLLSALHGAS